MPLTTGDMLLPCYNTQQRQNDAFYYFSGNGQIEFNELINLLAVTKQRTSSTLKSADAVRAELEAEARASFKAFDHDGNGMIDMNELRLTMQRLGENLSEKELQAMMKEADENRDNLIDFEGMCRHGSDLL